MDEMRFSRVEEEHHALDKRVTRLEANEPHFLKTLDKISTSLERIGSSLQKHMDEESSIKWRIALAIGGGMGTVILALAGVIWANKVTILG